MSRTAYRALLLAVGTIIISSMGFGVSAASAAVQVDPDGPAGQQYALPLDAARGQSAGDPSVGVPGASAPAPLFGEGISPPDDSGRSNNPKRDGGRGEGGDGESKRSGGNGDKSDLGDPADPEVKELISGTSGGTSSTLEMILLVGGMTLVGLTAGLLGRRTL